MNKAILRFPNFREKAFTLNYDDGLKYDEKLISVMQKYGFKGTFNINSGLCANAPQELGIHSRLTLDECVALYKGSGNEAAVHGKYHTPLIGLERSVAADEVLSDRKTLERAFRQVIKGMAYPYSGAFDEETKEVLKNCGIVYSRTVDNTHAFELPKDWLALNPTCHHTDEKLLDLAREFAEFAHEQGDYGWYKKTPKWFIVWGHSTEFTLQDNWDRLEKLGEILGNREDIWYATTGEVYDYLQAFESLEFSLDNRLVRNKSAIDIYIVVNCGRYIIPAGQTVEIGELSKGKELL